MKTALNTENHSGFRVDTHDGLHWITIDHARRMNALNRAMWKALPGLIKDAESNEEVKVILLTGAGDKAFCAGADISEFGITRIGEAADEYDRLNNQAFDALTECTKPIIAVINGFAMGGGFQIAACCDLRIASENALFAVPAAKLGIGYNPRWIKTLLTLLSPADLKEILFTGERFSASDMKAMRFLNHITTDGTLHEAALTLAQTIGRNAPLSIHASKLSINVLADKGDVSDGATLDRAVKDCFESDDYDEGRRAFMEKRIPKYRGK